MDLAVQSRTDSAPWRLEWLTPFRCRVILAAILLLGFLGHLRYLTNDCPLDLSGDEAHYWDWSRQLDWSYYSKGPLVAWIIRGSCAVFGDVMWAVRLPALILAVGTSLFTYTLARRLFQSDRVALGAVLLNHVVPMFIAGSVLMTIDPPMFFCWAAATYFAARAVLDGRRWAWVGMGVALGLGFLAKYGTFLWIPGLFLFLLADRESRRHLRSVSLWIGLGVALLFTIPIIIWNAQHGWVSLWHVTRQTGTSRDADFSIQNLIEFLGGQIGAVGPPLVVILVGAVVYAIRRGGEDPNGRSMRFLLFMGLPYWIIVATSSLRTKVQANWPAPAYFGLLILAAYFLSTRLQSIRMWKPWRVWVWMAVGLGVIFVPIAHNTEIVYPLVARFVRSKDGQLPRAKWDFSYKLRGWRELGRRVSSELEKMPPGSIILCEDYQATAEMAFYADGQPRTYCVGSWFADPDRRARHSQYDIWPDRQLDRPELVGRSAVFIGYSPTADLRAAFDKIEELPRMNIVRRGFLLRSFQVWRCSGFKGMRRPPEEGKF